MTSMEPDKDGFRFIGKPVRRAEDERLITGKGRFSDDFKLDHQAYAAMVRSRHPHARIRPDLGLAGVLARPDAAGIGSIAFWARAGAPNVSGRA